MFVRGGHIIQYGVNSTRYTREHSYFNCSLHAEMDLLRKCKFDLNGGKLLVYRFNSKHNDEHSRTSKPCLLCSTMLKNAGIKKIFFVEDGQVQTCKTHQLPSLNENPVLLTRRVAAYHFNGKHSRFNVQHYAVA